MPDDDDDKVANFTASEPRRPRIKLGILVSPTSVQPLGEVPSETKSATLEMPGAMQKSNTLGNYPGNALGVSAVSALFALEDNTAAEVSIAQRGKDRSSIEDEKVHPSDRLSLGQFHRRRDTRSSVENALLIPATESTRLSSYRRLSTSALRNFRPRCY